MSASACFFLACKTNLDLAFVVDSSGSIGQNDSTAQSNWIRALSFVNEVIGRFSIGINETHVALVKFSTNANVEFYLNSPFNLDVLTLQSVVGATRYVPGNTNTAAALQLLLTGVFVAANGDRPDFPNLVFVITDGQSNINAELTIPAAVAVKQSGARIISIGITSQINPDELRGIASTFIDVYYVNAYTDLGNISDSLVGRSCPSDGMFSYVSFY